MIWINLIYRVKGGNNEWLDAWLIPIIQCIDGAAMRPYSKWLGWCYYVILRSLLSNDNRRRHTHPRRTHIHLGALTV